ncbi:MAG: ferrous iron transport protein B [Blautia sp.]|jgi:ferrous iron transport protein B
MGLTNRSTGKYAQGSRRKKEIQVENTVTAALAGNPNVGKSTVFNALTGMNQHTGNWPGKTVTNAQGRCMSKDQIYTVVDLPGTYSLMAHSAEEEVARNYICFGDPDMVIVVCDATCLERNLNLVLQTMEITSQVIVCVNLLDEARKKKIHIDLKQLSAKLGVPVVGTVARNRKSLRKLLQVMDLAAKGEIHFTPCQVQYCPELEKTLDALVPMIERETGGAKNSRWLALKLLDADTALMEEIKAYFGAEFLEKEELAEALEKERQRLEAMGLDTERRKDFEVTAVVKAAEEICKDTVTFENATYTETDRRIDRILTGRRVGYPVMILMLAFIFWLTITGANYPSQLLAQGLFWLQDRLTDLFVYLHAPDWLHGALVLGVYRVLAWVISVMLPPMAIFFPLFTLLEDVGYLPRIAYNLDKPFQCCHACGKQALTMCMGFGCNAAGIVGCRIIDSPRERLLAILTNNFVPCNGRFPTLIAILTMFFAGSQSGVFSSAVSAALLTGTILLGVGVTFLVTKLLSHTILKGVPSSFTLELPPYRRPQVGKVIVRSIFDRTLFVLGRAAAVAAPAGLLIWILANVTVGDGSLLQHCAGFLDPFARLMGLDGVILLAFLLGFPANEIVIPIVIMAYMAQGSLMELGSLGEMKALFLAHGWTWTTAVSTMLFSLMHWPCSTALLTVKKETGSWKWTALAALLPTVIGIVVCMLFTALTELW